MFSSGLFSQDCSEQYLHKLEQFRPAVLQPQAHEQPVMHLNEIVLVFKSPGAASLAIFMDTKPANSHPTPFVSNHCMTWRYVQVDKKEWKWTALEVGGSLAKSSLVKLLVNVEQRTQVRDLSRSPKCAPL